MNIENLWITKENWESLQVTDEISKVCYFGKNDGYEEIAMVRSDSHIADSKLIAAAPEMFEALIIDIKHDLDYLEKNEILYGLPWSLIEEKSHIKWGIDGDIFFQDLKRKIISVQKSTGKTWEEIKEML